MGSLCKGVGNCSRLWSALQRRAKRKAYAVKGLFTHSQLPVSPDGKVRIHLGCGDVASPEFINVDARSAPHVHYVHDVTDLSIFPDGSADLVYACHVLEHVPRPLLQQTLSEWKRVLKPGGVLRLSVPDFDKIVNIYQACDRDLESILSPLMGGQDYSLNTHYSAFNYMYLSERLREIGFREIGEWDARSVENHDFEDWASKRIKRGGQQFEISLNVEAVRSA